MSDYLKSTNFATKDALPSGNPGKIVKGTEIDTEFNAIADAVESKADLLNPVFSGLLTTDTLATTGAANIGGTLSAPAITASDDITQTGTGALNFAKGTTAQRPASPVVGATRYNTTLGYLENYNGTVWKSVGDPTPADVSDEVNTSTGYFQVPVGITAQRPSSPPEGLIRYNSEFDIYEGYINSTWHRFQTYPQGAYTINFLIVAGGGGTYAGYSYGGGAGGGGYRASSLSVTPGATYTMIVGGGGASGQPGTDSSITGVSIATGGGKGGAADGNGGAGGSGGGGGNAPNNNTTAGGAGISGQGFNGGGGVLFGAGGGGGANGQGGQGAQDVGGAGGAGILNTITGSAVYYAGGGGGGSAGGGAGGIGGGGNGGPTANNGGINTGGGAGCGGYATGAVGGSGVIILSIPTVSYSGVTTGAPTVTVSGANTILKFTTSGTYTA